MDACAFPEAHGQAAARSTADLAASPELAGDIRKPDGSEIVYSTDHAQLSILAACRTSFISAKPDRLPGPSDIFVIVQLTVCPNWQANQSSKAEYPHFVMLTVTYGSLPVVQYVVEWPLSCQFRTIENFPDSSRRFKYERKSKPYEQ